MNDGGYTKARQVDQFGNVSYAVQDYGGEQIATIDKRGAGRWQVTLPSGSWVPVGSVKAGLDWLTWADSLRVGSRRGVLSASPDRRPGNNAGRGAAAQLAGRANTGERRK